MRGNSIPFLFEAKGRVGFIYPGPVIPIARILKVAFFPVKIRVYPRSLRIRDGGTKVMRFMPSSRFGQPQRVDLA